jgi:DNA-binding NarL/FixJ family response regulator
MTARRSAQAPTTVCVVEYNPLAAAQLNRLLAANGDLQLVPYDDILNHRDGGRAPLPIFILDRPTLPVALSRYLRTLRVSFPDARTIVLDQPLPGEELCRLLFLGIQGFLPYGDVEAHLPSAIHTVAEGHLWVAEEVLEQYVRYANQMSRARARRGVALTRRERRILELIQRRLSNKEISSILEISEGTVKFHVSNIFAKLGVNDRQAAADAAASDPLPRALVPQKSK